MSPSTAINPLANFMRQPKIYISLPSKGAYWKPGSIDLPNTGEIPVYSMTAKDEITFKIPDALMNGQAVVDVIQSCCPNIKDAWATPNTDIDTLLIAIRIATYGEMMEISHTVPKTDEEVNHQVDLRLLLDQLSSNDPWNEAVYINDQITCFIHPLTYRHMSEASLKTFQTQKMMQAASDKDVTDEQKISVYTQTMKTMTDTTIELMVESIDSIQTPDTVVRDKKFIREFLDNADKDVYAKIQDHVAKLRDKNAIKPLEMSADPELVSKGAPEKYLLPITMDNSDFFGRGS